MTRGLHPQESARRVAGARPSAHRPSLPVPGAPLDPPLLRHVCAVLQRLHGPGRASFWPRNRLARPQASYGGRTRDDDV